MKCIKNLILFSLFFISTIYSQDLKSIEKQLCNDIDQKEYWFNQLHTNKEAYLSFEHANKVFEKHLLTALNNKATLKYNFPMLGKKISITTSKDKNFRSYSWDTYEGGSMKDLQTVFQYKGSSAIKAVKLTTENDLYRCTDIYSFINNGKTIYIPVLFCTMTSSNFYTGVFFFTVEGNELKKVNCIKTTDGLTNEYGVEYKNFYGGQEQKDIPEKLINFDSKTKILKFIKTNEKQEVLIEFENYKFNGTYFVKN